MALYFTKKKRWPPSKPIQYVLAVLGLLLALSILFSWLMIRYHRSAPSTPAEPTTPTTLPIEPQTEIGHCLVILDFDGAERFLLIKTNPNTNRVIVAPIPNNLTNEGKGSLSEALDRYGAPKVTEMVAAALQLPLQHHAVFSPKGIEEFLGQLDSGIQFDVPEPIIYTDENSATIRLNAGDSRLSASQIRSVLEHKEWKKNKNAETVAADLTVAAINQYLVEGRSLYSFFAALSNATVTDLRIDNFNAYQSALEQLAQHNTGKLCYRVDLKGTTKNGLFLPDVEYLRQNTDLYK